MKCTNALLLLLLLLYCLILLTACSDSGGSSSPQTQRTWYWEHELTGSNAQVANENHTVVLRLKPDATAVKAADAATVTRIIPYTYKNAGTFEYCIKADDPFFVGLSITSEATGKVVASVQQGACVQASITPGKHSVAVTHKPLPAGEKERLAFVSTPRSILLAGQKAPAGAAKSSTRTVDLTTIGKLALADPAGNVLILSSQQKAVDGKPNYFLIALAESIIDVNNDLFWFVADPNNPAVGHNLMSARGKLGAYYPSGASGNAQDLSFGDCQIQVTQGSTASALSVQSPLYTYSASNGGTPPAAVFSAADAGNYKLALSVDMIQWSGIGMTSGNVACVANQDNKGKYAQTLEVLFRYYEDGTKVPPLLQQGEVALFERPNFTGKAYVFIDDQSYFRVYNGITAKSVRVGPNTRVGLYSAIDFGGLGFSTSTDVSDLGPTNVGPLNKLGSLKISPDIQQIFLSSNACRSCDLSGLQVMSMDLKGYDFTNANLSGSKFSTSTFDSVLFTNATLVGAQFEFIDDSFFTQMIFNNCDFTNAVLDNSSFQNTINVPHATYPYLLFKDSKLNGASFRGASLYGVSFDNSTMAGTDMSSATIIGSIITCGSDLSRCLSSGADNSGKSLRLNLQNATISGAISYSILDKPAGGLFALDLVNPDPAIGGTGQNCRYFDITGATIKTNASFSYRGTSADLSNCSYRNVTFAGGVDLSNVTKPCADMTNFTGCVDFSKSYFNDLLANLFSGVPSDLRGAIFEQATIKNADFSDALLNYASFKSALAATDAIDNVLFTRAAMNHANLSNAVFNYANFQGANLSNANLSNGSFFGALFSNDPSGLQKQTVLDGAYLQNTNMASADLSSASMRHAAFHSKYPLSTGTCLPDSNKKTTNCASAYKAIMVGTNLSNAYLVGLDMSSASLYGANFANSILVGANFTNAVIKANQGSQPNTSFQGAVMYSTNFTNVALLNANLGGAYFDDPATTQGYATGGMLVSSLDINYTSFPGSSYAGKPVCVRYQPASVTLQSKAAYPGTDASSICPDQSSGPCRSNSSWLPSVPLDALLYRLTYNYSGSPDPPPAPSQCSTVVFW